MTDEAFKKETAAIAEALETMSKEERATFFRLFRELEVKHRPPRSPLEVLTDYSDRMVQELNADVPAHAVLCATYDAIAHKWELSSNLFPESLLAFIVDVQVKVSEQMPSVLAASKASRARGAAVVIWRCRGCGASRETTAHELTPGDDPRCEVCGDVMGHLLVDTTVNGGERKAS